MKTLSWLMASTMLTLPFALTAQQVTGPEDDTAIEEVLVTGSHIQRKSFDGPSPVQQITAEDIKIQGASTVVDIATNLTINTSSDLGQNNLGGFTAGGGSGNFNLRGLGTPATLTLIDGHRSAPRAGGSSYVNIGQIPSNAVERIDILKTGASATYGSDAVAGVVNIITKKDYDGVEINMDYRDSDTVPWDEWTVSLVGGASSDRARATVAIEIKERSNVSNRDIPSRYPVPSDSLGSFLTSSFGQPGSFKVVGGKAYQPDPECSTSFGLGASLPGSPGKAGTLCNFDIFPFFTALPEDERRNAVANFEFDVTDDIQLWAQVLYNKQTVTTGNSPTLPFTKSFSLLPNGGLVVPASHPDYPAELATSLGGGAPVDLIWRGRPMGSSFSNWESHVLTSKRDELRLIAGLTGDIEFGKRSWHWAADVAESYSDSVTEGRNDDVYRMQEVLDACRDPADPLFNSNAPGCWNPFGNQSTTGTSNLGADGLPNEVFDFFHTTVGSTNRNKLFTVNAVVSGGIWDLPGGELGVAIGMQYRDEEHFVDRADILNRGRASFSGQSADSHIKRDVTSIFGELAIPIYDIAEVQVAVRTEDYGGSVGRTTDPRIAIRVDPTDWLTLRGSWGTSFRAPPLNRLSGGTTGVKNLYQPDTGTQVVRSVFRIGQDLVPEEAESWSAGFELDFDPFTATVDIWDYTYEGLLTTENEQALVDSVCSASGCNMSHPSASRIDFDAGGEIVGITVGYINAAMMSARGVDVGASWSTDLPWFGGGTYNPQLELTYIDDFEIQTGAGTTPITAVGNLNMDNSLSRAIPEVRANFTNGFTFGDNHRGAVIVRYVDGVDDLRTSTAPELTSISSRVTVDARYSYDFSVFGGETSASIGVINLFDDEWDQVDTESSYAPDLVDPRGRVLYFTLNHAF